MPERVVYLLGAGFSAPLGLPLMANFVSKSKDQFSSDPNRFEHFGAVYSLFNRLAKVREYYKCDLSNIEEVLSILSIGQFEAAPPDREAFVGYLCDVIEYYTPQIEPLSKALPSNWRGFAFGENGLHNSYGNFVLALCRLGIDYNRDSKTWRIVEPSKELPNYSVITLNYDCVIEHFHAYCIQTFGSPVLIGAEPRCRSDEPGYLPIAKLHGSVCDRQIVPPTWSKGSESLPSAAWQVALAEIRRANHIRIIGYSLPESDLNVRYLLKAGALDSFHLKSIDVMCLDSSGETRARFDGFIDHRGYRFRELDVTRLLTNLNERVSGAPTQNMAFVLEQAHDYYMQPGNS